MITLRSLKFRKEKNHYIRLLDTACDAIKLQKDVISLHKCKRCMFKVKTWLFFLSHSTGLWFQTFIPNNCL